MPDALSRVLARAVHMLGGPANVIVGYEAAEGLWVLAAEALHDVVGGRASLADALDLALEHDADPERVADVREVLSDPEAPAGALAAATAPSIPEPAPLPGGEPVTPRLVTWLCVHMPHGWEAAVALVEARDAYGRAKYGQPLCIGDGRDAVEDLRQELGDALQYAVKARIEAPGDPRADEVADLLGVLAALVEAWRGR